MTQRKHAVLPAAVLALSCAAGPASASLISFVHNDTVSVVPAGLTDIVVGDAAKITVNLDNGGSGLISQTWTSGNLQSVVFDFKSGTLHTVFTSPFGSGLTVGAGSFTTNAAGSLVSVMSNWMDVAPGSDYTTNGQAPESWFLNNGGVYYTSAGGIYLTNGSTITTAANWTEGNVPVPATVWLLAVGLAGIGAMRRGRRASLGSASR